MNERGSEESGMKELLVGGVTKLGIAMESYTTITMIPFTGESSILLPDISRRMA